MPLGCGRHHKIRILHWMEGMRRIGIDDSSIRAVLEHGGMRSPSFGINDGSGCGQLGGPERKLL